VKYYKAWKLISITLLFVLITTVVYYSVLYHIIMEKVISYIQLKPQLLFLSYESMVSNMRMHDWTRESVLDSTVYNLTSIIPMYQHTLSSHQEFTSNLDMYHKSVLDIKLNLLKYSLNEPEIEKLLFTYQQSSNSLLSHGLHYAQIDYLPELLMYKEQFIQQSSVKLQDIHSINQELISYEYKLGTIIQDILDSRIKEYTDLVFSMIILYCILMILWLLLVFIPTINRVDTNITYAWKFYLNFNLGDI
jgi:hypothetical protein